MGAWTGQRQAHPAAAAPAVVVHRAEQAAAALELAGGAARGVLLLSAPGAALGPGAAWFLALVAQGAAAAGATHPAAAAPRHWWAALDCGDAPGHALAALRRGARLLILSPACPAFPAVAGAAAEIGAVLWPERPRALDLAALDLRREGGRRRLAQWLAGAPGDNGATSG